MNYSSLLGLSGAADEGQCCTILMHELLHELKSRTPVSRLVEQKFIQFFLFFWTGLIFLRFEMHDELLFEGAVWSTKISHQFPPPLLHWSVCGASLVHASLLEEGFVLSTRALSFLRDVVKMQVLCRK